MLSGSSLKPEGPFISQVTLKVQPGKRTREGPAPFSVLLAECLPSFWEPPLHTTSKYWPNVPSNYLWQNSAEYGINLTLDDCLIYTSKWRPKVRAQRLLNNIFSTVVIPGYSSIPPNRSRTFFWPFSYIELPRFPHPKFATGEFAAEVFVILATRSVFGIFTVICQFSNCGNWAKSWERRRHMSFIKKEFRLDI